jgi:MraZ protein
VGFQGPSSLSIDAKGRISVPARHRDELQTKCEGKLTLTRHPEGCLLLYPRATWEIKRNEIEAYPPDARPLKRLLLGNAVDVDIDASGRILIPPELRTAAKLDKDAELRGMGAYFELWDAALLAQREAKDLESGEMLRLANNYLI